MFTLRYETLKYVALCSLAAYAALGIITNPYPAIGRLTEARTEMYPFFSWFLFAQIPNPAHTYVIRLVSYGDERHSPPLRFEEISFLFKEAGQYPTQYIPIIKAFALALLANEDPTPHRAKLEQLFHTEATYQVVSELRDPIEYWKTGSSKSERVLGTFSTHGTR